jgi:hypothetical protein
MSAKRFVPSRRTECECGRTRPRGAEACPRCLALDQGGWGARRGGGDRGATCGIADRTEELDAKRVNRALTKWLIDRGLHDPNYFLNTNMKSR